MTTTQLTELILANPNKAYNTIVTTEEIDTLYCQLLAIEENLLHVGNNGQPLTSHDYKLASQKALRRLIFKI